MRAPRFSKAFRLALDAVGCLRGDPDLSAECHHFLASRNGARSQDAAITPAEVDEPESPDAPDRWDA